MKHVEVIYIPTNPYSLFLVETRNQSHPLQRQMQKVLQRHRGVEALIAPANLVRFLVGELWRFWNF